MGFLLLARPNGKGQRSKKQVSRACHPEHAGLVLHSTQSYNMRKPSKAPWPHADALGASIRPRPFLPDRFSPRCAVLVGILHGPLVCVSSFPVPPGTIANTPPTSPTDSSWTPPQVFALCCSNRRTALSAILENKLIAPAASGTPLGWAPSKVPLPALLRA